MRPLEFWSSSSYFVSSVFLRGALFFGVPYNSATASCCTLFFPSREVAHTPSQNQIQQTILPPLHRPVTNTMSASILSPQAVAFATAMAAVSGTVILLAIRLQKSTPQPKHQINPPPKQFQVSPLPRPCISSSGSSERQNQKNKKKTMKRVRFAERVVDRGGERQGEEEDLITSRRRHPQQLGQRSVQQHHTINGEEGKPKKGGSRRAVGIGEMPANWAAMYHSILRDRCAYNYRLAYAYQ